jgi:predicted signal transduction protein with EAL and GGDEF domain
MGVYHGEWLEKIKAAIDAAAHRGITYDLELQMTTSKGNQKWVRTIGAPVIENGEVVCVRGSMQEITAQKAAQEKIRMLAHYDMLTVLPNRALLTDRVKSLISTAYRTHAPLTVLFLDLDNFKISMTTSVISF